jgi:uracil-DNA glycosylase
MSDIFTLINQVQQEAERETFPIDIPVYEAAQLKPTQPVLYAGNLKSHLCFFGRDLGRDEVHARQPLYGAAGTLVRQGFYQALHHKTTSNKEKLQTICDRVLLTNTVPYKPPGNKAYSTEVKNRFRPFMEQLLVMHWQGNQIITLGTEAFKWFAPYGKKGELDQFFRRSDRYSAKLPLSLMATDEQGIQQQKTIFLMPLPHPSPLNAQYYAKFPQMLQQRLNDFEF